MKKNYFFLILVWLVVACKPIDFDNPMTLTNEEATQTVLDLGYKLTSSSVQTFFQNSTGATGIHLSIYADQTTNTTNASARVDFSQEPRLRLTNNVSYRGYSAALEEPYSGFYQANLDATLALDIIENQEISIFVNGEDRTVDCQVGAYFVKGVSQGYLGVIFDRGIIVDEADESTRGFPNSYSELIENGINWLDKAISLAESHQNLKFDFLSGVSISREDFIRLANSLGARILSSVARDHTEAQNLGSEHWQKVLDYTDKGFKDNFIIPTVSGGYYNIMLNTILEREASGAGSRDWVDIKLPHLADRTGATPNFYPQTGTLPAIETDDRRFYQYFKYTTIQGNQFPSRGHGLVSNHIRERWYNTANTLNVPGASNPYFLAEEIRFLRAEAKWWLGDFVGAADELNDATSARKRAGELPDIENNSSSLIQGLHYEYAIEIDAAGGIFVPFTFMRRHDLLIGGTPTQYPVPQEQLELVQLPVYTFGGSAYFGEKGIYGETATANNTGWKPSEN